MAKYPEKAGDKVHTAIKEMKKGELKSGGSGKKVTSRKQAIAIGLSEAREEGAKVPEKASKKTATKKTATKKTATKKTAEKSSAPKKTAAKKTAARKKTAAKKSAAPKKTATKTSAAKKES